MWAPQGATDPWSPPGSSQQSPWVLEEAMCLKSQITYCFACVLSFYTKQMAETPSRGTEQQGSTTLPSTLTGAADGGTQLTRAQPAPPTKSSPLPQVTHLQHRSLEKVIPAPLLLWGSAGSFSSHQQLWESREHSHGEEWQFIWQGYPRPASCLQHWVNTLHGITKSCGLGTNYYSCQTHYCSTHLQKYLVVKPSYSLLS